MVARASQVAVLAALAVACEAPARVKPWRHSGSGVEFAQSTSVALQNAEAAGQRKPPTATATDAGFAATRAHTLRVHVEADPGPLVPRMDVAPTTWARRITFGTMFEPLVHYGADGTYAPGLARRWQVLPGGGAIRIELQPNVVFHDGRPFTAVDVQYTLDSVRAHSASHQLRAMLDDVTAVELISPLELRLRLKRPSGWVLRALAEIPIVPMHVFDSPGAKSGPGELVGTGPWKWTSSKDGVIHLSQNPRYWGNPPAIADLEFVVQRDAAVALTAAKRGELDIIPALIPAHWPEQAGAPSVVASFRPLQLAPPKLRYLAMNTARVPMDDVRVRHAMALLVDRRAIAKRVFGGLARPVLWPIWPGGPANGPETAVPDFDPTNAGKLLDASGWIDSDKDGIRDQSGTPLRLVLIATTPKPEAPGAGTKPKSERELFVEASRRAGIVVEVRTGSETAMAKWLAEGAYDLVEFDWSSISDSDIAEIVPRSDSSGSAQPRVASALEAMRATWDSEARTKLTSELAAALAETWPIAGLVAEAPQGLIHKRVANMRVCNGWINLSELTFDSGGDDATTRRVGP